MKEFLGQNQFVWWHGVVEDVADPLMLGRVRVRVYGYHSDDRIELPIASLPWAYPMQPITSAALSGIGTSPTGLLVGSHVFGFFRDGSEAQDPIVIGSFGGIPMREAEKTKGFHDPSGRYPATVPDILNDKFPRGVSHVSEADTNRLARNDDLTSTVLSYKKASVMIGLTSVPDMKGKKSWTEPITPYAAEYPKNHVKFTERGHIEEFDDTPGKERIHQFHTSGTFTEVGNGWTAAPDGTRVQRVVGDDYEIVYGNKKVYIAGDEGVDLIIEGGLNITVFGGGNIQLSGDTNVLVKGNINLQVDGNLKASAKQMEFFADDNIAFSGKVISFKSDGSVMNIGERIEVNSGEANISPSRVNLQ